jgi:hypothetical protein
VTISTPPAPEDPPDAGVPEGVPSVDELDLVAPGLTAAVRQALEEARLQTVRERRACALLLPRDEPVQLDWDAVETYAVDQTGTVVLEDVEVRPEAEGHDEFYACVAGIGVGAVRVVPPDGFSGSFQVRHGGRLIYNAPMSGAELEHEVAELRARLERPSLTPAQRGVAEDALALYECYVARGLAFRRECQEASLR